MAKKATKSRLPFFRKHFQVNAKGSNISVFDEVLGKKDTSSSVRAMSWDGDLQIPDSLTEIHEVLGLSQAEGKLDQVAYILVTPVHFAVLFLQGNITVDQLDNSEETSGEDPLNKSISVNGVQFLGREFTVMTRPLESITKQFGDLEIATIDASGNVI